MFPILIHLMNNKANHIVNNAEELPRNLYFKIVDRQFSVDNKSLDDVSFRRIEPEPSQEVEVINDEAQEDTGSSVDSGEGRDTSSSSADSSGASL